MAWKDLASETETAAELKSRLASCYVELSKASGSTISATNGKVPLRQKEVVTIGEYRGLTQAAAQKFLDLFEDNTTSKIYYSAGYTTSTRSYIAASVKTGTITTISASRVSESAGWTARVTTTEYSADAGEGWSDTRPAEVTYGVPVRAEAHPNLIQYEMGSTYTKTWGGDTEYPFLTYTEAKNIAQDAVTNTIKTEERPIASWRFGLDYNSSGQPTYSPYTYTAYYNISTGMVTTSEVRYIDEVYGWTVTLHVEQTTWTP